MWTRARIALGKTGEDVAIEFLRVAGYKIIERNYKTPLGEIDAIAKEGGLLVFVEIKTRLSSSVGPPYLSVTWKKKRKIIQNAGFYFLRNGLFGCAWRIDVVSVKLGDHDKVESIEIIKNAVGE
jgi:putative endonuclease